MGLDSFNFNKFSLGLQNAVNQALQPEATRVSGSNIGHQAAQLAGRNTGDSFVANGSIGRVLAQPTSNKPGADTASASAKTVLGSFLSKADRGSDFNLAA